MGFARFGASQRLFRVADICGIDVETVDGLCHRECCDGSGDEAALAAGWFHNQVGGFASCTKEFGDLPRETGRRLEVPKLGFFRCDHQTIFLTPATLPACSITRLY